MKKISPLLLALILMGLSFTSVSQDKDFTPGSYINNSGDTISGFFQIKDLKTFSDIQFKANLADSQSEYLPFDNCKSVSFGNHQYISWFGARGMAYVTKMDFIIMYKDSFNVERIPLKVLYKGNHFTLLHYRDVKDHFFIGVNDSIQELLISYRYPTDWERRNYIINAPRFIINPIYHNQLISLMGGTVTRRQEVIITDCVYEELPLLRTIKQLDKKKK
ncbi:MAG: hypothetical protein R2765_04595 [Ferruginibacter sp.]|nr:hypothetical protein [Bacteroidota bacterium]MBX2918838.1 hypothetical protein [Ferruginibacter sp.]MCB0708051.1 hypothetical protein [Chitinophagaceae bacterium]